ncbi:MAG: helix-turn-helix transcriptional regulator [Gemmatimonadetes bacterium]|nr:helix-turn-helix transcriptional regulator [Gemmatimonadota bacterium]
MARKSRSDHRLKRPWFYILLALVGDDLHGSAVEREVLALSGGSVRLWPVSLYGSLQELSDRGLISELAGSKHPSDESEKKRYYRITKNGRRVLAEEARDMADTAQEALARLST